MANEPDELPHPVEILLGREEIERDFQSILFDRASDAIWHFRADMHKLQRGCSPEPCGSPAPEAPVQALASFRRDDLDAELHVVGVLLDREVHPSHWLDLSLAKHGVEPLWDRDFATPDGIGGDMLVQWTFQGREFVGRFVARKFGPRLFVTYCKSSRESYRRIADEFNLTARSLHPLDDTLGPFAEPVQTVEGHGPVHWKVYVPASWEVRDVEDRGPETGFGAFLRKLAPSPSPKLPLPGMPKVSGAQDMLPTGFGHLWMTVLEASLITDAELEENWKEHVLAQGLEPDRMVFREETVQGSFESQKWLWTSSTREGFAGPQVYGRIVRCGPVFVSALALLPWKVESAMAWMQGLRLLDMVTTSIEVEL
jgi:hypothetical protein